MHISAKPALSLLLMLGPAVHALAAGPPESWIPARWEGGPLETARRGGDPALKDPAVQEAVARWYEPSTLSLLDGAAVNCLLLTLSAGADPKIESRQRELVREYALQARERGLAVLGIAYAGARPADVAASVQSLGLDGAVLDEELPDQFEFASELEAALRATSRAAVVIPLAPPADLRPNASVPVLSVQGTVPNAAQTGDTAAASATAGLWIDSNLWLVRSFRTGFEPRPVWISQRPTSGGRAYSRSVADAAAAGGRWLVALEDEFRSRLFRGDAEARAEWREVNTTLRFFEDHAEWRDWLPFGNIGIVLDAASPNLAHSEEYLNLVARRQIPYQVIARQNLSAALLEGLRAVLAFDLNPPSAAERKLLLSFVSSGGLLLGGPAWGKPPKDQSYQVAAEGEGELVIYKESAPDPQTVARDLNDLLTTPELGLSIFDAPSVLSFASQPKTKDRLLVQLVNYAGRPAGRVTIWATGRFRAARLLMPGSEPREQPIRLSGDRTEVTVSEVPTYAAILLEK